MTVNAEFAKPCEKEQLKAIYNVCFPNEEGFADWYFEEVWKAEYTSVIRENGKVIAMFHALPAFLEYRGMRGEGLYLFALGTLPQKRGMRLGAKLYEFWFDYCREKGLEFVSVLAAEEGLVDYYCTCGMSAAFYIRKKQLPAQKGEVQPLGREHISQMNEIYEECTETYFREKRTPCRWDEIMRWYKAYGRFENGELKAYCFGEIRGKEMLVLEAFGEMAEELACAAAFQKDFKQVTLCRAATSKEGVPTGNLICFSDKMKVLAKSAPLTYLNMYYN